MHWLFKFLVLGAGFVVFGLIVGTVLVRRQTARWVAGRATESDEEFLSRCGIPETEGSKKLSLAMREALAAVAGVPANTIAASSKVRTELQALLDIEYVDWIDVKYRVKRQLSLDIPLDEWLKGPELSSISPEQMEFRDVIKAAIIAIEPR